MLTTTAITFFVFLVVLTAIVIRQATDYDPENPFRLWTTRIAVCTILLWLSSGLILEVHRQQSSRRFDPRPFLRGIGAVVVVWLAFRDEL